MLVLSRKPGEKIRIGDQVVVTVVRIGPKRVRLSIEAPAEMVILRDELCEPVRHGDDDVGRPSLLNAINTP